MPREQPFDQQTRRIALGCLAIFIVPFIAAGGATVVAGIRAMLRHESHGVVALIAGAAFLAVAVSIFAIAFRATANAAQATRLQSATPDQPWLWRDDWRERRIPDRKATQNIGLWIFAIFWNAITAPVLLVARDAVLRKGNAIAMVMFVFPAVGVGLLVAAIYTALRRLRFGRSVCTIDRVPIEAGRTFHGEVEMRGDAVPEDGYHLRLSCVRRIVTGSGRNRSVTETPIWSHEHVVSAATVMRSPAGGVRVPFSMTIPPDAQSTDIRRERDSVHWRLDVAAELPGVDYAATFELPVFVTATSADAREIASYRIAHRAAAAQRSFDDASGIVVEPFAGGIECRVAPRGRFRGGAFFVIFAAIWIGAIVLMIRQGAPLFMAGVFSIFGVLLVVAAFDYVFGVAIARADRSGINARREVFGFGASNVVDAAQIETIDARVNGYAGRRALWDVVANLRDGRTRTIARYIRDRDDAEALAARLWFALGRE